MEVNDKKISEVFKEIRELEELLTDRISDLYQVKGGMQARHAYIFYREKLSSIRAKLDSSIKVEPKKK